MKSKIFIILFLFSIQNNIYAVDTPCLNPFDALDWDHMADDSLYGSYGDGEESGSLGKSGCECLTDDNKAIAGVRIRLTLPIGFGEIVDTPDYFPCFQKQNKSYTAKQKLNGTSRRSTGSSDHSGGFRIAHFISYPMAQKLNVEYNNVKLGVFVHARPGIPFLGEKEVEWYSDYLAIFLQPKAILFNNPIAQLACIYDCVISTVRKEPVDWMTWCVGCWGAMKGATGRGDGANEIVDSALLVVRMLAMMHRTLRLQQTIPVDMTKAPLLTVLAENDDTVACEPIIFPEIIKSQYRYNLAYPFAGEVMDTGIYPALWETFKTHIYKKERIFAIWRRTALCTGAGYDSGDS